MNNNAAELLPCPFCSCKKMQIDAGFIIRGKKESVHIICEECGASIYGLTEDEAIEAWNTRTPEQTALNKAAGNWAHVDNLLRGLLEECESCPDTGCTQYIEKVIKPNMYTSQLNVMMDKIARLEKEITLAKLEASDDFKPKCDVCDRTTLLIEIEELRKLILDIWDNHYTECCKCSMIEECLKSGKCVAWESFTERMAELRIEMKR